jgi:hypothetical protein
VNAESGEMAELRSCFHQTPEQSDLAGPEWAADQAAKGSAGDQHDGKDAKIAEPRHSTSERIRNVAGAAFVTAEILAQTASLGRIASDAAAAFNVNLPARDVTISAAAEHQEEQENDYVARSIVQDQQREIAHGLEEAGSKARRRETGQHARK